MLTGLIIALIIAGLILILLELFVTPGIVTGLLGGVAWLYALYKIYQEYGTLSGHLALGGLILLLSACILFAVKSGIWNKVSLHSNVNGKVNALPDLNVNDKGVTLSALRPSGKANFDGTIAEVVTLGEMIDANESIYIKKIENNKIIVSK